MLNNKGFSLIEVLVAVGVMSLMSFFMMDMISNQNKAIKTTQLSMDINEAQNQIQRFMLDSEICKNSLTGYIFPQNVEVPITSLKRDATTILLSALPPNNKVGGVEVQSLSIRRKSIPNDKELELLVRFKKTNSGTSFGGDAFKPKVVSLAAQFLTTPANTVKNCFSQMDDAVTTAVHEACTQLCPTCTWDNINFRCVRPPAPSTALYIHPLTGNIVTGAVYQKDGDNYCHCYNPGCPAGSSQVGSHWCTNGGTTSHCGYSRWKYGHVTCRVDTPIGYLSPSPL